LKQLSSSFTCTVIFYCLVCLRRFDFVSFQFVSIQSGALLINNQSDEL